MYILGDHNTEFGVFKNVYNLMISLCSYLTLFLIFLLCTLFQLVVIYIKKFQNAIFAIFYYRYIKIYLMATEVGRQAMFPTHCSLLAAAQQHFRGGLTERLRHPTADSSTLNNTHSSLCKCTVIPRISQFLCMSLFACAQLFLHVFLLLIL